MHSAFNRYLFGAASFAGIFALWEAASTRSWVNSSFLPAPSQIGRVTLGLLESGAFIAPLRDTMLLLAIGYVLACVAGIATGLLMGLSDHAHGLLEPLVECLRPIPKPALVPVFFLFLGPGMPTKIVMVALVAVFPILINTLQGVRGVDAVMLDTARTLGLKRWSVVRKIIVPAAMPMILAGMRVSLGLGLVLAILAEMLEADGGVGFQVLDLQRSFQVKEMFSWIFVLGLIGLALNGAFEWLERRAVPWRSR